MKSPCPFPIYKIESEDSVAQPVRLTCCPVTLNPVLPGILMTMMEFDPVSRRRTWTMTARSYGPILFENTEIVEVHRTLTSDTGVTRQEMHWLGVEGSFIRVKMRDRQIGATPDCRRVDLIEMAFPVMISTGLEHRRTVSYFQGDLCADEMFTDTVSGPFRLTSGESERLCLRLVSVPEGSSEERIETYIDASDGRPVYAEIYRDGALTAVQQFSSESSPVQ